MSDLVNQSSHYYRSLSSAKSLLGNGDYLTARQILASLNDNFAEEIDALIRAGEYDEAKHRLQRYLNPKYPSVAACQAHVGSRQHYDVAKQRELL